MEFVSLAETKPGQVLARPVTNQAGAVLCQFGCALTEAMIERLANAGIEGVYIEGAGRQGPGPAERLAAMEERFYGIVDPALHELKMAVGAYLTFLVHREEEKRNGR